MGILNRGKRLIVALGVFVSMWLIFIWKGTVGAFRVARETYRTDALPGSASNYERIVRGDKA